MKKRETGPIEPTEPTDSADGEATDPPPSDDDPKRGMVTRAQAAKRLHISYATMARREANGDLAATVIDGIKYYSESEVDEYADNSSEVATAQLLRASKEIIHEQMAHNRDILSMSAKVAFQLLELQSQTTIAQRERIGVLESERDTLRDQLAQSQSSQHENDLALMREEAKIRIQAEGVEMLKAYAPSLIAKLVTGAPSLPSLSQEQLASIARLGLLTPEQIAALDAWRQSAGGGGGANGANGASS